MSVAAPALKRFKTTVENSLLQDVAAFGHGGVPKPMLHEEPSLLTSPLQMSLTPVRDERISLPVHQHLKGRAAANNNNNKNAGVGAAGRM